MSNPLQAHRWCFNICRDKFVAHRIALTHLESLICALHLPELAKLNLRIEPYPSSASMVMDKLSLTSARLGPSIGKRADPNSVRPDTRPIGRYTGRVSGWECCHPLRIKLSSVELRCTPSAAGQTVFQVGRIGICLSQTRVKCRVEPLMKWRYPTRHFLCVGT